ncbi:MAG: hypothetical protein HKN68_11735 [Saprospiraceae bacterium]|nr:hypothetical protein [Saprospiraceae bacterium]
MMQTTDSLATAQPSVQTDTADIFPYLIDLADVLVWPIVLLIILWFFNREFKGIFKRLQSIEATSSGLKISTFEKTLDRIESISDTVAEITGTSKSMAAPPDPFGPTDPRMKVAKVQVDLDYKLKKKAAAKGIDVSSEMSTSQLAAHLHSKSVIKDEEFEVMKGLIELSDNVMKGYEVSKKEANTILEIFGKLP